MALSKCFSVVLRPSVHRLCGKPIIASYNIVAQRNEYLNNRLCVSERPSARFFSASSARFALTPQPGVIFDVKQDEGVLENSNEVKSSVIDVTKETLGSVDVTGKEVIDLTQFLTEDAARAIPELVQNITQSVPGVITAADLNLMSWAPTNGVYHLLEGLHSYFPWWASIALLTFGLRMLMFPLVVQAQRNAALVSEIQPEMQKLQHKISEARRGGNAQEVQRLTYQLDQTMKKTGASMFKGMLVPMAQMPFFLSVFFALREMSNYPIPSMKEGGLFWFSDLTVPDPYFILPALTCGTLFVMFKWGVDFGQGMSPLVTKFMQYGVPGMTLVFVYSFNSALLVYWTTTNFISLIQTFVIRHPYVRTKLKIPAIKKWDPSELPKKSTLTDKYYEQMDAMKLSKRLSERRNDHERKFQKAGIGPLQKTYKTDPTKMSD
ncbi:Mitochondrial inner membrane protein OXA1L [Halotydeus destructor]|nr:Mitochondrial inner membrane protein OXA1L [Halotydeus destructor]